MKNRYSSVKLEHLAPTMVLFFCLIMCHPTMTVMSGNVNNSIHTPTALTTARPDSPTFIQLTSRAQTGDTCNILQQQPLIIRQEDAVDIAKYNPLKDIMMVIGPNDPCTDKKVRLARNSIFSIFKYPRIFNINSWVSLSIRNVTQHCIYLLAKCLKAVFTKRPFALQLMKDPKPSRTRCWNPAGKWRVAS